MSNVLIFIVVAAIAGGSVPPFAKIAETVFQPFTLVFIRFFFATLVLLPFVYRRKELSLGALNNLSWVSIIGSLNPILLFIALLFTTASVSPLIYAAVPLMTVLYMARWKNRSLPQEKLLGLIVGFIGVGIIVVLPLFQGKHIDLAGFAGNGLIFIAAIAFMIYGIISKEKQEELKISPLALTFYFCLVTLILSIPFSIYELWHKPVSISSIGINQVLSGLEVGVIGTSIFYLAYQKALKLSTELTASLFTYLQPIATIAFAIILLKEEITLPFVVGGLLAVVGARLASRKARG